MITVLDTGMSCTFTFETMMAYHGPAAPGGVAHAIKLMQQGFALLSPTAPIDRHSIEITTSFKGTGVRDSFELVTRAITSGRFHVTDDARAGFEHLGYRAGFVYHFDYHGKRVTQVIREGIVRDEFLALAGKGINGRSKDEEMHFAWLKEEMADRVMRLHPSAVFDIIEH